MRWESVTTLGQARSAASPEKLPAFGAAVRASARVSASVKEKSDSELATHYGLARGHLLTCLGVLLVGTPADRAALGSAPILEAIKYDERGDKVSKWMWDDHALSPNELIDAVWREVTDFHESYEVPAGLFRSSVPAYEKDVVREVLVNALVHRPYTQRGDIFLKLYPDRLEVVNPGRLPLGVTPRNILHVTRRRNDGLARIFYALELMELEGSGFDLLSERLLATGRGAPVVTEGADWVQVTVPRRIIQPGVLRLLADIDQRYQLSQRPRIALSLLGQSDGLSAGELAAHLELDDTGALGPWLDRLLEVGLVEQSGRTKGTRYHVNPALLRGAGLDRRTTLNRVEPHRLRALVLDDLERYPESVLSDVRRRVWSEIPPRAVKRALDHLVRAGQVATVGERRWPRYRALPIDQESDRGR